MVEKKGLNMKKLLIIVLLIVGCKESVGPEGGAGVEGGSAYLDECGRWIFYQYLI